MGTCGEKIEGIKKKGRIPSLEEQIPINETELKKKDDCFCKINGRKVGTGFFCKINYKDIFTPVLITNYHIIDEKYIEENNYLKFYINNKSHINVNINKNDILYSSPNIYDIIIIKLKENSQNDINYLEIDGDIFKYNSESFYKNERIYILHYPNSEEAKVSYGKGFEKLNDYDMKHLCNTEPGSSGGPILSLVTNKVIGIHKGFNNIKKYNIGTFLKFPLNELNGFNNEIKMKINEENINKEIFEKEIDKVEINKISKNNNEIKMKIKINKGDINKKIYFIYNKNFLNYFHPYNKFLEDLNESKVELYIDNKKEKYKNYFIPKKEGIYLIKFKFNICIQDFSSLFYGCENLVDINLSSFNSSNIIKMSNMFHHCKSLISLSGISKWNTSNVNNMDYMFSKCEALKSLPDILNWNTSNITKMHYMFSGCESLKSLPDISKWDTSNVTDMTSMFENCESLKSLPDISKWNTSNVTDMASMFEGCKLLISLPDISKWNISNVNRIMLMFSYCESLISLPNISKWDISKVRYINRMFEDCKSLISLPDISKWNTSNVIDMASMFENCKSLISVPNISKWDISKVDI